MTAPTGNLVTPVGFDSNGIIRPLLLGADGSVLVSGPSPSYMKPIPRTLHFENLSLPAGTSSQTALTVPAGKLYRLNGMTMQYIGTVAGLQIVMFINNNVAICQFNLIGPVVNGTIYTQVINDTLDATWSAGVSVIGATLNDNLYVNVFVDEIG